MLCPGTKPNLTENTIFSKSKQKNPLALTLHSKRVTTDMHMLYMYIRNLVFELYTCEAVDNFGNTISATE